MTDKTITMQDIDERITDAAEELLDEYETFDEARDHASEAVDSWDWIIYPHKAQRCFEALDMREQEGAWETMKDMGGIAGLDNLGELYGRLTFYALENMLMSELQAEHERRLELKLDEEDDDNR